MNDKHDVHCLCLEAFAGISAMVTHDLKNTLAIINENAGLLDDLALMAEDAGVPTERVQKAAAKVTQQVTRSNTIIKNLNRFAHSGDTPVARAEIGDILQLMADLTTRKAAMRNLTVTVQCEPGHQVELALFQLEALIYLIFIYLYSVTVAATTITVTSHLEEEKLVIRFGRNIAENTDVEPFPGKREQILLESLQGRCEVHADAVLLTLSPV